ncbi:MAG: ABC transporter substrate-binding protein, partial [Candidatus Methanomethylophilaceae archaeon]
NAIIAVLAVVIVVAAGAAVVLMKPSSEIDTGDHIDAIGNEIKKLDEVNSIACVGQNSLRICSYLGVVDKVKMVDSSDIKNYMQTYLYAIHNDIKSLPSSSANCSITPDDAKKLIDEIRPDVIIMGKTTCYDTATNEAKSLMQAGLNVVVIDDYLFEFVDTKTFEIEAGFVDMIKDVAYAVNANERGEELLNGIEGIIKDIRSLVDGKDSGKTGYIGCILYNGKHPLDKSIWSYSPFALAGLKSILPEGKYSENGNVSVETYSIADLTKWSDENTVIFLDALGFDKRTEKSSMDLIQIWKDNQCFTLSTYVGVGMNYDNGFVNAYQVIHYIYGDSVLSESEMDKKIDAVYDVFFGTHISQRDSPISTRNIEPMPDGSRIYDDIIFVINKVNGANLGEYDLKEDGTVEYLG